jgi:hypothetical protein
MFVTPHLYGLHGSKAPLLHLRQLESQGIFANFAAHFEAVWATGMIVEHAPPPAGWGFRPRAVSNIESRGRAITYIILKLDTGEARSASIQSAHEFVGFAPNLVKVLYLQRDE